MYFFKIRKEKIDFRVDLDEFVVLVFWLGFFSSFFFGYLFIVFFREFGFGYKGSLFVFKGRFLFN